VTSATGLENDKGVHTKRKAACVATSGPSLGRKRPKEGSDSGMGMGVRYRIGLAKTIVIRASIARG
jgi:hypothetical protein